MPLALPRQVVGAAWLVVVHGLPNSSGPYARGQSPRPQTRTIYVSATDKNGAAITDMQAPDFEIKDGGKTSTVVSVAQPEIPLRIALLDADQGTGAFQLGIARFMQKLLGHAEFALYSIVVQPEN